jgi:hypothetical protein
MDRLQPCARTWTGDGKRRHDGGHYEPCVRDGDDRLPGKPHGEPKMGGVHPIDEI